MLRASATARDVCIPHGMRPLFAIIKIVRRYWLPIIAALIVISPLKIAMAQDGTLMIDDRGSGNTLATSGGEWRLITDGVMGGVSDGQLSIDMVENEGCLRLKGDVKLDNSGGFVQAALDLSEDTLQDIQNYTGLMLAVYGNDEHYNVHLRTRDNRLPWQSYRTTFTAAPKWKIFHFPFAEFSPYRTDKALVVSRLKRIGVVAIGREFRVDICIGKLGLYK